MYILFQVSSWEPCRNMLLLYMQWVSLLRATNDKCGYFEFRVSRFLKNSVKLHSVVSGMARMMLRLRAQAFEGLGWLGSEVRVFVGL